MAVLYGIAGLMLGSFAVVWLVKPERKARPEQKFYARRRPLRVRPPWVSYGIPQSRRQELERRPGNGLTQQEEAEILKLPVQE